MKSAEDMNMQTKQVTPLDVSQVIIPDDGYDALTSVTVNAIPNNYARIDNVTATTSDVIDGKVFVDSSGVQQNGILSVTSYYVGTTTPSSSLGADGDLYFMV